MKRNLSIRQIAAEKIEAQTLKHKDQDKLVTIQEIDQKLGDIYKLTQGGIQ